MDYRFAKNIENLKPSAIREILKAPSDADTISFAAGNPAPESFPVADMSRISAQIYRDCAAAALQYSITEGYPPLRADVAERNRRLFGIGASGDGWQDETLIVSGGTQGIELACRVLCNPGDEVICEDPTFIGALNAFRSAGAVPVGVPLTPNGIDTDALARVLATHPRARMLYIIPTFQNPTGISWDSKTRTRVYELARQYGVMILEDNPYGELRFAGEDLPTIKSADTEGIVIYCSSFSKILSAGMRIGYVIAPNPVTAKMTVQKQVEDVHTNLFFQMLCHRYLHECDMDAHIRDIRQIYRHKCTLMLDALDAAMPDGITYTHPQGGLFIWCTLPKGTDSNAFLRLCEKRKVRVVPGAAFNCDPEAPSDSFRLNYSTPSDAQITKGIQRLADAARELLGS